MKKYPYFILFAVILLACSNPRRSVLIGELNSIADTTDTEMAQAIREAKQTLPKFENTYNDSLNGGRFFTVKINTDGVNEIWLYHVLITNGTYMGEVSTGTSGMQFGGEVITIDTATICDWLYLKDKKLIGGYTVKVQYNRMTAAEKKAFDDRNGFVFE